MHLFTVMNFQDNYGCYYRNWLEKMCACVILYCSEYPKSDLRLDTKEDIWWEKQSCGLIFQQSKYWEDLKVMEVATFRKYFLFPFEKYPFTVFLSTTLLIRRRRYFFAVKRMRTGNWRKKYLFSHHWNVFDCCRNVNNTIIFNWMKYGCFFFYFSSSLHKSEI